MNDNEFEAAVRDYYASVSPEDSTRVRTRVSAGIASVRTARPSARFGVRLNPTRALAGIGLLAVLAIVAALLLRSPAPGPGPVASGQPLPTANRSAAENPDTFAPTGSMLNADETTATLLQDGRVLFAGSDAGPAELYDPGTGTFSATGRLPANGGRETATLLKDGRVLFVGGWDGAKVFETAQIYDPATGTFSPTGSQIEPRLNFTATLLADGRVLIAGGWDSRQMTVTGPPMALAMDYRPGTDRERARENSWYPPALASTEIYDPATGKFSRGPNMKIARDDATAVRLLDGRVLMVGGADADGIGANALNSAELFDPATDSFEATGSLSTGRIGPSATLLTDGRVLVSGATDGGLLELYDPGSGTFAATGAPTKANAVAALLHDGRTLLVGGWDSMPTPTGMAAACQIYDPQTGRSTETGSMSVGRLQPFAITLADGRVLVAGGNGDSGPLTSAELYVPGPAASPPATPASTPSVADATLGTGKSLPAGYDPWFRWSPDGRSLAVMDYLKPGLTSPRVRLFDRDGSLVRTLDDAEMLTWLDGSRFLLLKSGATYLGSMAADSLTRPKDLPADAGRYAISSERGTVALNGHPFETVWSPDTIKTVDAESLAGWSHDGTKLVVLRTSKAEDAYGKKLLHLEVLRWPELDTVASLPDGETMFDGFDPSDRYMLILPCSTYDLQTRSMIRAPGDTCPTQEDGQIVWYRDGLLAHASNGEVTQYSMSWEPLATVDGMNSLVQISASGDGSTVLFRKLEGLGSLAVLRHGAMSSLVLPERAGETELSPDGSRLVVVLGLDEDGPHQMLLFSIP